MNHPDVVAVFHHWQLCYRFLSHQFQRVYDEVVFLYCLRIFRHDVFCFHLFYVRVLHEHSSEVAVGDDAYEFVVAHYSCRSKYFLCYLQYHLCHDVVFCHLWFCVFHAEVAYAEVEAFAKRAAWMELGEVLCAEASAFQQSHRECVAHDELCRGASSRSEVVRTSLVRYRGVEDVVGFGSKKRSGIAYYGDELVFPNLY